MMQNADGLFKAQASAFYAELAETLVRAGTGFN